MKVNRSNIQIKANPKRVILNYLRLGLDHNSDRVKRLVNKVLSFSDEEVETIYDDVLQQFAHRHLDFEQYVAYNFEQIKSAIPAHIEMSPKREMVMGAYFSKEYSIQSAALFNPSMVSHPDQDGLQKDEKRFVLSLRSVGEGHISSIEFRSGIVDINGTVTLDKETGYATCSQKDWSKAYHKNNLQKNMAVLPDFDISILTKFRDEFTYRDYEELNSKGVFSDFDERTQKLLFNSLDTNYDVSVDAQYSLCERVIFPNAEGESMGMEDVRFVAFTENGKTEYIGTYTAYNGHQIFPQLIMTHDFVHFRVRTMYGMAVNDKGMALFPEKINGNYVMLGRQGGENITLMYSKDLFIWQDYQVIMTPDDSWGLVQLGNCGSPIKTSEGWLVITHAVGLLRKYVLGAILLDSADPSKIIKKLNRPLLSPNEEEREGYVPNVVYSCGAMEHNGYLVLPYAMSDSSSSFATLSIEELLKEMESYPHQ